MTSVEVYGKTRRTYQNAHPSLRELFTQNLSDETFLVFDKERYSFEVGATLFCVNSVDEN
ncbi:MAG TPA: hypothetical protein EYQ44_04550 [Porticoccaceae bacterium]|nr:hypothetical protein [Porticoccaceae bacterium]HIG67082.1 hypothetical protein [Porticoccaceae bacterium]HIK79835.1 hypothetical protein [Porticoccaceae bacterium]